MLRLTGTDRAVAEIAAVAEHVASLTAATAALRLQSYSGPPPAGGAPAGVPPISDDDAGDASAVLADIREWASAALGRDEIPDIWRVLAHQPRLLAATWRKDRLILGSGALDEQTKTLAALAVASFRQSDYWIGYFTDVLRNRDGVEDKLVVEIAGAVMHYVSFNTVAHAMRLEAPVEAITASDVVPGGHLEEIVPGVRKRVKAPPDQA